VDLQHELGLVAQVNQDIGAANARIAELASEAGELERVGQMLPKALPPMVGHLIRVREKLALMNARLLMQRPQPTQQSGAAYANLGEMYDHRRQRDSNKS
jgi:hypothetical protein